MRSRNSGRSPSGRIRILRTVSPTGPASPPELFSVALFEDRAVDALRADCAGNCRAGCPSYLLAVRRELDRILDYLGIGLI